MSHDTIYQRSDNHKNIFGITYPCEIKFSSERTPTLQVTQNKVIDSSFFYLRFLSEMKPDSGDGKIRITKGITEHLAPKALHCRWLDWLVNMRIGRNGKEAFLP